jgi:hypothetical protein
MNRRSSKSRTKASSKKKTSKRSSSRSAFDELKSAASRVVKRARERAAGGGPESATKLLTKQHDEVRALFKRIESTRSHGDKLQIFDELAQNLVAHDAIEREIFYPACEQAMGMNDLLGEALVEHGVVEFSLFQADEARRSNDFEFKCTVLKEMVEHHVKEEEDEFFPRVERALGKEKLLELGVRLKERFEEVRESDFRTPLRNNLNQVLAGTLKPSARSGAKSGPRSQRRGSARRSSKSATGPKSVRRRRAA